MRSKKKALAKQFFIDPTTGISYSKDDEVKNDNPHIIADFVRHGFVRMVDDEPSPTGEQSKSESD